MPWFRRISRSRVGSWRGRRRDQGATLILLHPLRLAMSLLLVTVPAAGQRSDLCAVAGPRTIRGVVVDSAGKSVNIGAVWLSRRVQDDGRLTLQQCGTPIGPDGSFEFTGMVSDSLSLTASSLWPTRAEAYVPAGIETVVVTLTLATPPSRVRDFADFDIRPAALQDPQGIPGCYWLGHPWGPDRVIKLRPDRRVGWPGDESIPLQRWEDRGRQGVRVFTFESQIWGWAGFTMDLSPPVDWSAIPTLFESKTDGVEVPDEWESFVTRVPCPGAP